mgnify:FL=1
MTQPQQPFGEARACPGACAYCGRPLGDTTVSMIDGRLYHWQCTMPPAELVSRRFPSPLVETAEPVDAAELLRGHERRLAALEDAVRRLTDRLDATTKAQAL